MNPYFCLICHRLIFFGNYHPCYTYMSKDTTISLPRLEEEVKNGLMENSNANSAQLCSKVMHNVSEKCEHVPSLTTANIEKLPFTPASNWERNSMSIFERTSKNVPPRNSQNASLLDFALNTRMNEGPANEYFQENVEPQRIPGSNNLETYKTTSLVAVSNSEEKKSGSNLSNLFQSKGFDGYGESTEERKLQSLNKDKDTFIDALGPATRNACSDTQNISGPSSFYVNSDLLSLNEESDSDKMGALGDTKDDNIPNEVPSQIHKNSEEIEVNEEEAISFIQEHTAVAGPSRMRPSKKLHACGFCPKQFKFKSRLDEHIRVHTGDVPFACDKCGKNFSKKSNHDIHYRTHTGEKPFVCDVCGNAFALRGNLTRHIQTHTGEKPFVCEACGGAFALKSTLVRHIQKHTGEKPFKCPVCGKRFADKRTRYNHKCSKHM